MDRLPYFVDLTGVAVFAISGALAAGRKSLDLLGVVVIAAVTAIGGGTIRDLLLDREVFWLRDAAYLTVIAAAALATTVYVRFARVPGRALELADAAGLALFGISGAQIAESAQLPGVVVVLMATITGVAGGVLRDMLTAEIPMIFRQGNLYATAVIAGACVYLAAQYAGVPRGSAALLGMAAVLALRLAAIVWGLKLPVFSLRGDS